MKTFKEFQLSEGAIEKIIDKAHAHFTKKHGPISKGAVRAHLLGGDHQGHADLMKRLPSDYGSESHEVKAHFGLSHHDIKKIADSN